MVIGPVGELTVSCKSTELKRCSMIEMCEIVVVIIITIINIFDPGTQFPGNETRSSAIAE